eukprot:11117525-Alexandrium_andersonii.AAC.1
MVFTLCVLSRLLYALHVLTLTATLESKLDAVAHRMLRIITGTPATFASKVLGVGTIITNEQLRRKLGVSK